MEGRSTMADWHDIKKAFERDAQKAEKQFMDDEQTLLKSIADYICSQKGVSSIQGYKPEEIIKFLEKPANEIKECLGKEWSSVSDDKLSTLIYSLTKKVQKSDTLTTW